MLRWTRQISRVATANVANKKRIQTITPLRKVDTSFSRWIYATISLQNIMGVSYSPQKKKLPNERKLLFHRSVLCIPYLTGLLLHNSFWWASSCTSTAIDAAICVYYIDVTFANCAYRAFVLTGTASDTFVCDKMSHNLVLSNTFVRFFLSFCIPFSEVRTAKIITNSEKYLLIGIFSDRNIVKQYIYYLLHMVMLPNHNTLRYVTIHFDTL